MLTAEPCFLQYAIKFLSACANKGLLRGLFRGAPGFADKEDLCITRASSVAEEVFCRLFGFGIYRFLYYGYVIHFPPQILAYGRQRQRLQLHVESIQRGSHREGKAHSLYLYTLRPSN